MVSKYLFIFTLLFQIVCALEIYGNEMIDKEPFLYKIISVENWEKSQMLDHVVLSSDDDHFIHFSQDNQLDRIIGKYWNNVPQFIVLKINTEKLTGKLVYETNHGGSAKYYHLYNGSIPLDSVVEARIKNEH